jgi:hypothetical protein
MPDAYGRLTPQEYMYLMMMQQRQQQGQPSSPMTSALFGGGSGGGIASLFGGSGAAGAGLTEGAGGTMIASGAIPSGFTGVGTAASGGTLVAPSSQAAASSGLMSVAIPAAGAVGAIDLFKNNRKGIRAPIQGAASGAAIGSAFGPAGTAIGAGVGGLAGLGQMAFGRKSTKERESDRWKSAGKAELGAQMEGYDYFAGTGGEQSRDEKYLTANAIRRNPDNYNNVPDWDKWDVKDQDTFLNTLLSEGKVSERKGGIYYDDNRAKELASQIKNKQPLVQLPAPAQQFKGAAPLSPPKGTFINKPLVIKGGSPMTSSMNPNSPIFNRMVNR